MAINRNIQATDELKQRLGADLVFPIAGSFEPVRGVDTLLQDIQQLLLTIPGERVMRPDFGCTLRNQVWENIQEAADLGQQSIEKAIEDFEPRITLLAVNADINSNTDLITFNIQFIINETDSTLNLIFPFRVGTQLSFQ